MTSPPLTKSTPLTSQTLSYPPPLLTQILLSSFIRGRKESDQACFDGFIFSKDRTRPNGDIYWQCRDRKTHPFCTARLYTQGKEIVKEDTEHNQPPSHKILVFYWPGPRRCQHLHHWHHLCWRDLQILSPHSSLKSGSSEPELSPPTFPSSTPFWRTSGLLPTPLSWSSFTADALSSTLWPPSVTLRRRSTVQHPLSSLTPPSEDACSTSTKHRCGGSRRSPTLLLMKSSYPLSTDFPSSPLVMSWMPGRSWRPGSGSSTPPLPSQTTSPTSRRPGSSPPPTPSPCEHLFRSTMSPGPTTLQKEGTTLWTGPSTLHTHPCGPSSQHSASSMQRWRPSINRCLLAQQLLWTCCQEMESPGSEDQARCWELQPCWQAWLSEEDRIFVLNI